MKKAILLIFALTVICVLCISAYSDSPLPKAENAEIYVERHTRYAGKLRADENTVFFITTMPRKGEITLTADGTFTYTPQNGNSGRDYFGYRVKDAAGNVSEEATVIIRISRG